MVRFLLQRPIAVVMAFLAFVIIGVVTYFTLPVSLLPSIDIPRISVRLTADNTSARELETVATAALRRQLQQVSGLDEIHSETRDGSATITMTFDYGVDIDLAFIAVNEKIDAAMGMLPRDMDRPKVIKASATDIPVLYLNMTLRDDGDEESRFLEMANVADNAVRRRIEQLPEVAMVDVSGVPSRIVRITPDPLRTKAAGITAARIEQAVSAANNTPGGMTVREGYYEYNVNVSNKLRTPQDVADVYMRVGGRIVRLGDVAEVAIVEPEPQGMARYDGKRAVTLAVIKQSEENVDAMKEALAEAITSLGDEYPQYQFSVSRNQTDLLDFTISNLVQNLVLGLILVFLVTALFMGDLRTPFVIGLSIVVALILTFLLFYLFHVSLNVVSLSGLILAVGMMIDNSVIVTENITQWRSRGLPLADACDRGTNEMITPLLSSSLTTIAVFVPLVFMSGIAGAIFTDQAFSISAGLAMSYVAGIMLLPVLYKLFFTKRGRATHEWRGTERLDRLMARIYNRGIDFIFARRWLWLTVTVTLVPLCVLLFNLMEVERMPRLDHKEMMVRVEWNENITARENAVRVRALIDGAGEGIVENSAAVGVQDFMLEEGADLLQSDAEVYLRAESKEDIAEAAGRVVEFVRSNYPLATVECYPPDNIFEKIFSSDEPEVEVRLYPRKGEATPEGYADIVAKLTEAAGAPSAVSPLRDQTNLVTDNSAMAIYNVNPSEVDAALEEAFREEGFTVLHSFNEYLPVTVSSGERNLENVLTNTMVRSADATSPVMIPLSRFVSARHDRDFRDIDAGKNGEYLPVAFDDTEDARATADAAARCVRADGSWEAELSGALFSNSRMMREMVVILLVSVVLMYFILCAQFESFSQPLIVLLEIPVDTAFALLTLWIFGYTLNLMSAIGIIVTCGIVVNDSILKLDAINVLRKEGVPLLEAIHTAGTRRLRPIVMTSLTTILAMVPMLFTNDMGSQLQRPLAVAMIGSMVVGTLVSVFIIPLVYYMVYKNHYNNEKSSVSL